VPTFVVGFILQYVFSIQLGLFRTTVGPGAPIQDLILPAIVLATVSFAYIVRLTRASVADNMQADFVRTATAKGLTRGRVVRVHILRNSLIPVVTFLGVDIGSLMVGAIVTEGIFNINGVGGTVYQAIKRGEGPTVVSFVAVMVIIYMLANLLVDLLYAALDPRIRYAK
jgi:oligopeptide transport system permease protein